MSRMLFVGGPLHGQVREWTGEPMHVQGPVDMSVVPPGLTAANEVTFRTTSKMALYVSNTFIVGGTVITVMVVTHITPPVEPRVAEALTIAAGLR